MLALMVVLCLAVSTADAAVYYVDASAGSDSNSGDSPATAWKTLGKVNGFAFAPGDRVRFKRGGQWRGRMAILRQGTAAAPIVFEPYGEGAPPELNSSSLVTNWSDAGTNLYKSNQASRVEQLFVNGVRGTQRPDLALLTAPGDWHWGGGVLTLYSIGVPGVVEAAIDLFALWLIGASHVHVDGFQVARSFHPVWMLNTTHCVIENVNVFDGVGYAGIVITAELTGRGRDNVIRNCEVTRMMGSSAALAVSNKGSGIYVIGNGHCGANRIENNRVHDNGHEGILLGDSDNNVVSGNTVYGHAESGIRVGLPKSHSNLIERNTVYGNALSVDDRFGIDLIYVGNDNVVRYNTTFGQQSIPGGPYKSGGIRFDGNDGAGTVLTESTGNTAYYNLVYDEFTGINVFSFSNVSVWNNTVVATKDFGIAVNAPSGVTPVNTVVRNNLVAPARGTVFAHVNLQSSQVSNNFYFIPSGSFFGYNNFLLSYTTYKAFSGLDAASLTGDPLFVDATALDFRLSESSPAIDRGVPAGLSVDFVGTAVPWGAAPDIGAYEYHVPAPPEGEGATEGEGAIEGSVEGNPEGSAEGAAEGEGASEGFSEGMTEGATEGNSEGVIEGTIEGGAEGQVDGEGTLEGQVEGMTEGEGEGGPEGLEEGAPEGDAEGAAEGSIEPEGEPEGLSEEGEGEVEEETGVFDFSASAETGQAPLPVAFTGLFDARRKAHEANWHWDFGDGSQGDGPQESHVYHQPGVYTVTLTVTTPDETYSVVKPNLITVAAPLPLLSDLRLALFCAVVALLAGRKAARRVVRN